MAHNQSSISILKPISKDIGEIEKKSQIIYSTQVYETFLEVKLTLYINTMTSQIDEMLFDILINKGHLKIGISQVDIYSYKNQLGFFMDLQAGNELSSTSVKLNNPIDLNFEERSFFIFGGLKQMTEALKKYAFDTEFNHVYNGVEYTSNALTLFDLGINEVNGIQFLGSSNRNKRIQKMYFPSFFEDLNEQDGINKKVGNGESKALFLNEDGFNKIPGCKGGNGKIIIVSEK